MDIAILDRPLVDCESWDRGYKKRIEGNPPNEPVGPAVPQAGLRRNLIPPDKLLGKKCSYG
jgi:hypothetical protein